MLRSVYEHRMNTSSVERLLMGDPHARLCVVYGIVMVVCVRKGQEPHFVVLDVEPLGGHGFEIVRDSEPGRRPNGSPDTPVEGVEVGENTYGEAKRLLKRRRGAGDGNERESQKRRRGPSKLSLG
ncbi:hypothetical protein N8I77_005810 [Diaporthe amygdali]|uniref:Uncharacterized protein n=1 Tax=Phomopsis amygdali TaxID=1214568 RepID=A0AAD9W5Y2_PHOAM|nr:hypothetical protein N8I77_005810 [Diaporthe amygdali]